MSLVSTFLSSGTPQNPSDVANKIADNLRAMSETLEALRASRTFDIKPNRITHELSVYPKKWNSVKSEYYKIKESAPLFTIKVERYPQDTNNYWITTPQHRFSLACLALAMTDIEDYVIKNVLNGKDREKIQQFINEAPETIDTAERLAHTLDQ